MRRGTRAVATSFTSFMSLAGQVERVDQPAAAMMAVPCWSSWNTGMSITLAQALFDDETVGRLDVLQVDAAEGRAPDSARN